MRVHHDYPTHIESYTITGMTKDMYVLDKNATMSRGEPRGVKPVLRVGGRDITYSHLTLHELREEGDVSFEIYEPANYKLDDEYAGSVRTGDMIDVHK